MSRLTLPQQLLYDALNYDLKNTEPVMNEMIAIPIYKYKFKLISKKNLNYYKYIFINNPPVSLATVCAYDGQLNHLIRITNKITNFSNILYNCIQLACIKGHLHVVDYLYYKYTIDNLTLRRSLETAYRYNNLNIINYLEFKGVNLYQPVFQLNDAISKERLSLIKNLITVYPELKKNLSYYLACSVDKNINIIKYLCDNGADIILYKDAIFLSACTAGDLDVLQYINKFDIQSQIYGGIYIAIKNNNLNVIKFIHQNYNYLFKEFKQGIEYAAHYNNIEILKYYCENNFTIDFNLLKEAISGVPKIEVITLICERLPHDENLFNKIISLAAEHGRLSILQHYHSLGANITYDNNAPIRLAAIGGHLAEFIYLHENGADTTAENNECIKNIKIYDWVNIIYYLKQNKLYDYDDVNVPYDDNININYNYDETNIYNINDTTEIMEEIYLDLR